MPLPALAIDYQKPVQIAEDVYWVGFYDASSGLHCNPYIIIDHGEAVLIDAGSRPDFSTVMMKILDLVEPSAISTLILDHYDPDLCGSVPIFEEMIGNPNLQIISHYENIPFIKHYAVASPLVCLEALGGRFRFGSGRELRFYRVPFSHAAGSFMTLDTKTGTLFTGDLFGSYSTERWELFIRLESACASCQTRERCTNAWSQTCPVPEVLDFHRRLMTSGKALRHAMKQVRQASPSLIAPQHGSVIYRPADIDVVVHLLETLDGVGIDAYGEPS